MLDDCGDSSDDDDALEEDNGRGNLKTICLPIPSFISAATMQLIVDFAVSEMRSCVVSRLRVCTIPSKHTIDRKGRPSG